MRYLFYCCIIMLLFSCRSFRAVNKQSSASDSTAISKQSQSSSGNSAVTVESKTTVKLPDSIRTKPDSLKANFSFSPKDTAVDFTAESGTMKVKVSFNTTTGKGLLQTFKKPETIPTHRLQETSTRASANNGYSTVTANEQATAVKKQIQTKGTTSNNNYLIKSLVIGGIIVLLLLLIALYVWLRKNKLV